MEWLRNAPAGDGHRKGMVKGRSQIFNPVTKQWIKRNAKFTKKRFLFLNVYPALIAYLHRLFAFGNLPLDLNKETEAEPDYLDRTWLLHGRCCRDTTKWDCIQLLNALDVCEFALKDAENIIETDIEKTEKSLTE